MAAFYDGLNHRDTENTERPTVVSKRT